jgi:predicted ribonuclease toxin of YeeF-YezG toxin-antitoxin module
MKLVKSILTITAISSLIACGGGGGGGGGSDDVVGQTSATSNDTVTSSDTVTSNDAVTSDDAAATSGSSASQTAGGTISGGSISQAASENPASFTKVASTAEIVSNDSFMFKSSAKVAVDIIVPNAQSNTDYLTICLANETTATVDYSQCLLQTPISSQRFQGELTLTNDTLSLAIVLLDYDQPNKPHISFWSRADSPELITL